jgi:phosphate transport system substrate-binding protein
LSKRSVFLLAAFALTITPAYSRELVVVGTGDGMELLQAVAASYTADKPGTAVIVPPSIGSGGAIAAVGAERNELGRVARPLNEKELAQGLVDAPVMRIPSAIYVHPSAKIDRLSAEQLVGIYSGTIQSWDEVGGADLKIKVVRREEADSTLSVLRASMPGWKDLVITPRSKLAMTTQEAVETVKDVPGAIGFGPYNRALESNAVVLRIDGRHPVDQGYPSAVTLSLLYKKGRLSEDAASFIDFVKSPKAHQLMVNWGGVPVLK